MVRSPVLALVMLSSAVLWGCGKKPEAATAPAAVPAAAPAPAPVAAASAPALAVENPEMAAKKAAVAFALMEDGFKNDAAGK
jgi:hypothetical protein